MARRLRSSPLRRLLAVSLVAAVALPLSGCVLPLPQPEPQPTVEPEPTAEADKLAPGELPATLGFDDGELLPQTANIQWGDSLAFEEEWITVAPKNDQGMWVRRNTDLDCTVDYWEGTLDDPTYADLGDRAGSDALVALLANAPADMIHTDASDITLRYQPDGEYTVEARGIKGETWAIAARAFTHINRGVYAHIRCIEGSDPQVILTEVAENNPLIIDP